MHVMAYNYSLGEYLTRFVVPKPLVSINNKHVFFREKSYYNTLKSECVFMLFYTASNISICPQKWDFPAG